MIKGLHQAWIQFWIVLAKELRDAVRDRRSVLSALIFPLLAPAMIYFSFGAAADMSRTPDRIEIPIVRANHAPHLVQWLQQHGAHALPAPENPRESVSAGEHDAVLIIDPDYPQRFTSGLPAAVELVADGSRKDAAAVVRRLEALLGAYAQEIGSLRLLARGINPALAQPLAVSKVETASSQKLTARLLSFIPMFVVMSAFICGMQVAVDTTAGERERGSLEPLLLNPVPRGIIVVGKWLAATVFSALGVTLTLIVCMVVFVRLPLHELGLNLDLGTPELVGILAGTLPVAFMAAGLQVLVASFARSFKEAQVYLSLLTFVPVLPGMLLMIYPANSQGPMAWMAWMAWIPGLAQQVLLSDVLAGEVGGIGVFLAAGLSALAVGVGCVAWTAKLFRNERIIYGR
ncbi:MAG: ABC transporter permease [Nannocystaceae bacterium]